MLKFFEHHNHQRPTLISTNQLESPSILKVTDEPVLRRRTEGITMAALKQHNKREDCWLMIDGKAYDISNWISKHPGGDVILSYAGMDATDVFGAFHEETSEKFLPALYVGPVIDADDHVTEVTREHRAIMKKLKSKNLFTSNKLYYAYKYASCLLMWYLAFWLLKSYEGTLRVLAAGALIALFWQQCGWIAHDTLHHQIFKKRFYNDIAAYFVGVIPIGYSSSWWKAKHNLHHAVPNVVGFDPDIDTMPLLAWSEKIIEGELTGMPHIMIKYQYLSYFLLLAAARMSWLIQSILYAKRKSKNPQIELAGLALHWGWFFGLMIAYMNWKEALLFMMVSEGMGGILISMAFSLNHNGMNLLDREEGMEFNRLQVITARDIQGGLLNWAHWFMGGLDMQIEHHLFPRVPRHNLKEIRADIVAMCAKYGIKYHSTDFWTGTMELMKRLYVVSTHVK